MKKITNFVPLVNSCGFSLFLAVSVGRLGAGNRLGDGVCRLMGQNHCVPVGVWLNFGFARATDFCSPKCHRSDATTIDRGPSATLSVEARHG